MRLRVKIGIIELIAHCNGGKPNGIPSEEKA